MSSSLVCRSDGEVLDEELPRKPAKKASVHKEQTDEKNGRKVIA